MDSVFCSELETPKSSDFRKMDELRRVLIQRLETVSGLLALVVSDRDGVPIIEASSGRSEKIELCFR